MIFSYVVCSVPAAAVRTEPSQKAEMSSQLLFGERAIVLKQEGEWLYIECHWDHYEGWTHRGNVSFITHKQYRKEPKRLSGIGANRLVLPQGTQTILSPGSDLFGIKSNQFYWLSEAATYKGSKLTPGKHSATDWALQCSKAYLGTPYLWGGRSLLGIDCSGLAQMLYKLHNIRLPRNAAAQATTGETVGFLQEAQCGDLAFFDDDEGNIIHVGILLDSQQVLHASQKSGTVVIDAIDQGGIISKKLRKRTGKLRIVKRHL
ncbi:MAG: hydrolase [Sphingobacteriales bacterium]|nr:MAG: hydrolase [Sphingobacteriales bacterium]